MAFTAEDVGRFPDFAALRRAVEAAEAAGPAPLSPDALGAAVRRLIYCYSPITRLSFNAEAAAWLLARAGRGTGPGLLLHLLLSGRGDHRDWCRAVGLATRGVARLLDHCPWGAEMAAGLVLFGRLHEIPRRSLARWLSARGDDFDPGAHMGGQGPPSFVMRLAAGLAPVGSPVHRDFEWYCEAGRLAGAHVSALLSPRRHPALAAAAVYTLAQALMLVPTVACIDGRDLPYLASAGAAREFVRRRWRAARRAGVAEARRLAAAGGDLGRRAGGAVAYARWSLAPGPKLQ